MTKKQKNKELGNNFIIGLFIVIVLAIIALFFLVSRPQVAGATYVPDQCKNIAGYQTKVPEGYYQKYWDCFPKTHVCPDDQANNYDKYVNRHTEVKDKEACTYDPVGPNDNVGPKSSTDAPVCTDGNTIELPANLHVVRNGSSATVNFFITEGDHANLYWKVVDSADWQNAVSNLTGNSDHYVSYTVNDLDANLGYTFGVQQTQGCGGGGLATAVVVDPPAQGKTFRTTYWSW